MQLFPFNRAKKSQKIPATISTISASIFRSGEDLLVIAAFDYKPEISL